MTTKTTEKSGPTRATANGRDRHGLEGQGLDPKGQVHWNLPPAALYEHALQRGEGHIAAGGGFAAVTAPHTGRSPNDKFTVRDELTESTIEWGKVNAGMEPEKFALLKQDMIAHLNQQDTLFVRDARAGADQEYSMGVRLITPNAWQNLFAYNMFLRPQAHELQREPDFVILHAPEFKVDPARHGSRTETAISLSFTDRTVLICGTRYAGEIKKSIFTVLNYILPDHGVFPMHCSANVGRNGDVALFFGLSGTGKTTLSADQERGLIGDDEHGWSDHGVFNFEGGCYAKTINLSPEDEPDIYAATQRFGTILENVVLKNNTNEIDFADGSLTENTRACYPLHFIPNAVLSGVGGHPHQVVFLTADAFGVLPPIARLTSEQAMYYFLSGYTAKVAGTERGVTEPKATFSTCFGAPFLPRHPSVYADMLGERLRKHKAQVWLINTGWTGGPAGEGTRMKLSYTRAMVRHALSGALDEVEMVPDPVFDVEVPVAVPDVPSEVLRPRNTWKDPKTYDARAAELARMFDENFNKYRAHVPREVAAAGPKLG
ncbi:MAG: phosphoenolpyruvate carboxykinase (ATP) [Gemmatimonadetes bacterium]|nr:phosphoenolpyruvate carboxykinase (ATP) [Gemmatimonadota bacterium]